MTQGKSLVEDMARAICIADGKNPDADWRDTGAVFLTVAVEHPETWRFYEKQARACLSVLKDRLPADDRELVERLMGRAAFCRDREEVKTPELLEQAADRIIAYSASRDG